MSIWLEALKEWNSKREGKYMIPKKDTAEHRQVKLIQERMRLGSSTPEVLLREGGSVHIRK